MTCLTVNALLYQHCLTVDAFFQQMCFAACRLRNGPAQHTPPEPSKPTALYSIRANCSCLSAHVTREKEFSPYWSMNNGVLLLIDMMWSPSVWFSMLCGLLGHIGDRSYKEPCWFRIITITTEQQNLLKQLKLAYTLETDRQPPTPPHPRLLIKHHVKQLSFKQNHHCRVREHSALTLSQKKRGKKWDWPNFSEKSSIYHPKPFFLFVCFFCPSRGAKRQDLWWTPSSESAQYSYLILHHIIVQWK